MARNYRGVYGFLGPSWVPITMTPRDSTNININTVRMVFIPSIRQNI